MHPLVFTVNMFIIGAFIGSIYLGGIFMYAIVLLSYVGFSVVDTLIGPVYNKLTDSEREEREYNSGYRFVVYLQVPVIFGAVIWICAFLSTRSLSVFEWIGLVLSTSIITGALGITIAHELVHRKNRFERFLGEVILVCTCYMHFTIEHIHGHHKRVATANDPATAALGQSFYAYLPRGMFGGILSAWKIEAKRLDKRGFSFYSFHNAMIWYTAIPLLFGLGIFTAFGTASALFFFAQAFFGACHLELINYIQHYGLLRKKLPNGRYERIQPKHSWNSNHIVSNVMLIKLPTHSDHHAHASKPYQLLEDLPNAPQLPYAYSLMVPMALLPPLWRYVMDPHVIAERKRVLVMKTD